MTDRRCGRNGAGIADQAGTNVTRIPVHDLDSYELIPVGVKVA